MKIGSSVLLILISFFISSCRDLKEATVTGVDRFFINKINTEGIDADLNLKIKNTNSFGFSIYPSEFDIIYSGMHLGKAKLNKRVHIDGNTERVYSFNLKSNLGDLNLFEVMQLLNAENRGKIDIKGDLKAGKFFLKKKFGVNYSDKVELFK
jgi:LEA14-like dessication related protein